jgi:hypothetical protein
LLSTIPNPRREGKVSDYLNHLYYQSYWVSNFIRIIGIIRELQLAAGNFRKNNKNNLPH